MTDLSDQTLEETNKALGPIFPTEVSKDSHVFLDGDILCYRAACAVQDLTEWDDETISITFNKTEAVRCLKNMVDRILRNLEQSGYPQAQVVFCLSGPSEENFRLAMWPDYKGNRVAAQKPMGLRYLRSLETIDKAVPRGSVTMKARSLEADDLIGIAMGRGFLALSDDKDLKTCPGTLGKLTDDMGNHRITTRTTEEANWWLALQTLAGDSTDGIPGCPSVGLKTAEKLLKKYLEEPKGSPWEFIVHTYESKGLTEEDAVRTFHMVYILRDASMINPALLLREPTDIVPN